MNNMHKNVCKILNCIEHLLASVVTVCVSISAFSSLVGILVGIASSPVWIKVCAIIALIKKV